MEKKRSVLELRDAVSELGSSGSYYDDERVRRFLKEPELLKLECRLRACASGSRRWKLGKVGGQHAPSSMAHAFWGNATALTSESPLSPDGLIGLMSAQACGLQVQLWHYGSIPIVPKGVVLRDAREHVPLDKAQSFLDRGGWIHQLLTLFQLERSQCLID
jgi:hypothetical protein